MKPDKKFRHTLDMLVKVEHQVIKPLRRYDVSFKEGSSIALSFVDSTVGHPSLSGPSAPATSSVPNPEEMLKSPSLPKIISLSSINLCPSSQFITKPLSDNFSLLANPWNSL